MDFLKKVYSFFLGLPGMMTPSFVTKRVDTERYSIDVALHDFMENEVDKDDLLLDAGAGSGRFTEYLKKYARYESTDFEDIFHKDSLNNHDFICSLDDIPKEDGVYDIIINAQVLEHVEYPQKVIYELHRILKPGGKLFLTTNQMWAVHGAPYNFYFYSRYGLESLFKNAGFTIEYINPRGGIFWLLAKILYTLPTYIYYQTAYTGYKTLLDFEPRIKSKPLALLLLPIHIVMQILMTLIALLLFYIDRLDKQKDFTLGYACYVQKNAK